MMRFPIFAFALLILLVVDLPAQETSTHRLQSEIFGRYDVDSEKGWDSVLRTSPSAFGGHPSQWEGKESGKLDHVPFGERPSYCERMAPCMLNHVVFGWNPYWMGTAYENFDFSLLSDISYFSYEVDPATGNYTTIHSWKTTDLIPTAKAAGTRVNLCVTLFSGHATFFNNPDAKRTLIDSLIALVVLRDADGVNIDFEAVPGSQRANLAAFMRDLGTRFHSEVPGSQISIDIPAVDWSNAFDVVAMLPYVDLFIIMGYDFHWSAAPNTGPVSPKNNGTFWSAIDVTRSVNDYLAKNVPPEKLCLGLPWYGYDWPAANELPGAQTQGRGTARLYGTTRQDVASGTRVRRWDRHSSTPWFAYQDGSGLWRQTWYDDPESLGAKYDMLKMKRLAGTAIWALGYDGGYPDLWDLLRQKFTDCGSSPCTGTISDMGGPEGVYYPNDAWTFTIAPEGATSVTLSFDAYLFDLADDELFIYEGSEATGTPIAEFTGTERPGSITARSNAMTLRFVSDGDLNGEGFEANWNCSTVPLSVEENAALSFSASVHPNPTSGDAVLHLDLPASSEIAITLFDLTGRKIGAIQRTFEAGRHEVALDALLRDVPAGTYLLRLGSGVGVLGMVVGVR